jgi:RNA polymerase sigma-70 factor, ECF subfamily
MMQKRFGICLCPIVADGPVEENSESTVTKTDVVVFGCMTDSVITFPKLLASQQQRLMSYVVSLLGEPDTAWDVLQETNRVLLEKRHEFQAGSNFLNWALTVAQFQTMAWLRDQKRSRMIVTAEIIELMAEDAAALDDGIDGRQEALKACLQSLSEGHRELVDLRYAKSQKLNDLAEQTGRSVNALKQLFFRLRGSLANCIEQRLEVS